MDLRARALKLLGCSAADLERGGRDAVFLAKLKLRAKKAVRKAVTGRVPLMVAANQQWDRPTAERVGRALAAFNLVWIEEPLDAYDVEGHARLAAQLVTPNRAEFR